MNPHLLTVNTPAKRESDREPAGFVRKPGLGRRWPLPVTNTSSTRTRKLSTETNWRFVADFGTSRGHLKNQSGKNFPQTNSE